MKEERKPRVLYQNTKHHHQLRLLLDGFDTLTNWELLGHGYHESLIRLGIVLDQGACEQHRPPCQILLLYVLQRRLAPVQQSL